MKLFLFCEAVSSVPVCYSSWKRNNSSERERIVFACVTEILPFYCAIDLSVTFFGLMRGVLFPNLNNNTKLANAQRLQGHFVRSRDLHLRIADPFQFIGLIVQLQLMSYIVIYDIFLFYVP